MKDIIKKILKEESTIPLRVRRRLSTLEDIFVDKVNNVYRPEKLLTYRSPEDLLNHIMGSTLDEIHQKHFPDLHVFSNEWFYIWTSMSNHLKNKYKSEIYRYYHINTGN
jgi:hypothetical protein